MHNHSYIYIYIYVCIYVCSQVDRSSFRRRQMCICFKRAKISFPSVIRPGDIGTGASVQLLRNFPPVQAINKGVTSLEKPINQRDCIATYCPYWKIIYRREREEKKERNFYLETRGRWKDWGDLLSSFLPDKKNVVFGVRGREWENIWMEVTFLHRLTRPDFKFFLA